MSDIIIWIIVVVVFVCGFAYHILQPSRCPFCGTKMKSKSIKREGYIVSIEECPFCEYEIELDYEKDDSCGIV